MVIMEIMRAGRNTIESIAPCGLNCTTCYAYQRAKNTCPGCRGESNTKPAYCHRCIIANCPSLAETASGYCYDCANFPCKRLKQLDRRYRLKYHTGLIQNLLDLKNIGPEAFQLREQQRYTCRNCGAWLRVHSNTCPECKAPFPGTLEINH